MLSITIELLLNTSLFKNQIKNLSLPYANRFKK